MSKRCFLIADQHGIHAGTFSCLVREDWWEVGPDHTVVKKTRLVVTDDDEFRSYRDWLEFIMGIEKLEDEFLIG